MRIFRNFYIVILSFENAIFEFNTYAACLAFSCVRPLQVQKSIHLPITSLSSPRVLMCSASVGTEGSVTLQLRDSSDSNQSPAPLENALTIGYPDPEMLADVFGSLQTACKYATKR